MPATPTGGRWSWNAARVVLTLSAAYGGIGSYIADWNSTHIYNPRWPAHAKFHNAQSMSLGAALLLIAAALLWGSGAASSGRFRLAATIAATYCASQLTALLYPGTALADDPTDTPPPQAKIAAALLALDLLALALGERSLRQANRR